MRLRKDAKVELIRHVPLFAGCSKKELRRIASIADEIDFKEGKVLIHEGRPGREFFVLVDGRMNVSRNGEPIDTLESGEFFGEIALISNRPRTATVTASTPVDVLVITERDFRTLLSDAPEIQGKVLKALADRLPPELL